MLKFTVKDFFFLHDIFNLKEVKRFKDNGKVFNVDEINNMLDL